jgi:hypothetical protein
MAKPCVDVENHTGVPRDASMGSYILYGTMQVGRGEFRKDAVIECLSLECGHNKDIQTNDF